MRTESGKSKIKINAKAMIIIALLSVQSWASINYLIINFDEISNFYLWSNDPYFEHNNPNPFSDEKNFYKTDKFSINFNYESSGKYDKQSYFVEVLSPKGELISSSSHMAEYVGESTVNLTGFSLDPNEYKELGEYTVRVTVFLEKWGWVIKTEQEEKKFTLNKEIVDISASYTDEIYLQTRTNNYHHNIIVETQVEEAGESKDVANIPLDVYWLEQNGELGFITTIYTNENGWANTSFIRENTLVEDMMKVEVISHETDTYTNSTSQKKSILWMGNENNRHIVKNGADLTEQQWNEYTGGSPKVLELNNEDHHIYSPNGGDSDIENFDFILNPFSNENTYDFHDGTINYDGFDYNIIANQGTIQSESQQVKYDGYSTSTNTEYWNEISLPFVIDSNIGSVQYYGDYSNLIVADNDGINYTLGKSVSWDYDQIPTADFELKYNIQNIPQKQLNQLTFFIEIDLPEETCLDIFNIKLTDKYGLNRFLISEADRLYGDINYELEVPIEYINFDDEICLTIYLQDADLQFENISLDQARLSFDFKSEAIREINWDEENNLISFEAIGGNANTNEDYSKIQFGTEVIIPNIPFYNLSYVTVQPNFTIEGISNFHIPIAKFNMLTKSSPNSQFREHLIGEYNHSIDNTQNFNRKYNITDDIDLSPVETNEDIVFYLAFEFYTENLVMTDEIRLKLDKIIVNAIFNKIDSSFSNMEIYHEDYQKENQGFSPSDISYDHEDSPIAVTIPVNEQIPQQSGTYTYQNYEYLSEIGSFDNSENIIETEECSVYIDQNSYEIISSDNVDPIINQDELWYEDESDFNDFEIGYNSTTSYLYISEDEQVRTGKEYTISNITGSITYNPDVFSLGYKTRSIISFNISEIPEGIYNASINLTFNLDSIYDCDIYDFRYRRVELPNNWDQTEMQSYFEMEADQTDAFWIGDYYNFNININDQEASVAIDITELYQDVVYCDETDNIAILFEYVSGNQSNILETKDFQYFSSSPFNISMNHAKIDRFSRSNLEFVFSDEIFSLSNQNLVISYSTNNLNGFEIYYSNSTGDLNLLNIFDSSLSRNQQILSLDRNEHLTDNILKIRIIPIFNNSLNQKLIPSLILHELRVVSHLHRGNFKFSFEQNAKAPYKLILDLEELGTIEYGSIKVKTCEDKEISIFDLVDEFSWDIVNEVDILSEWTYEYDCDQIVEFIIEFRSAQQMNIKINQLEFFVSETTLDSLSSSGYQNEKHYDFDTIVKLSEIEFSWICTHGGNIEFYIKYGIKPTELVTSLVYTLNPYQYSIEDENLDVSCRYLSIYYKLNPASPESSSGPILQEIVLNAERVVDGNLDSLKKYNDGKEYIWALEKDSSNNIEIDFNIDVSRKTDSMVLLTADYVEFNSYGLYATNLIDEITLSIWNVQNANWEKLNVNIEKRSENTIESIVLASMNDYCDPNNGLVKICLTYETNHLVNLIIDYVELVFFEQIGDLIGLDYYHHLDLPRASNLFDLNPSAITDYDEFLLGEQTEHSSETQIIDDRTIKITRILKDYASGNLNDYTTVSDSEIKADVNSNEKIVYTIKKSVDISEKNTISGRSIKDFNTPVDIQLPEYIQGNCKIRFKAYITTYRRLNYRLWFKDQQSKRRNEDRYSITLSADTSPSEWKDYNNEFVYDTEMNFDSGKFQIYCWGKNEINFWESCLYKENSELTLETLEIAVIVSVNQGDSIRCDQDIDAEIPVELPEGINSVSQLRGFLISGNLKINFDKTNDLLGNDETHNIWDADYSIDIGYGNYNNPYFDILKINDEEYSGEDIRLDRNYASQQVKRTIELGTSQNCLGSKYLLVNGNNELCLRIRVHLNFGINDLKLSTMNWNYKTESLLELSASFGYENIKIIPLIAGSYFADQSSRIESRSSFDFSATYLFDQDELIDQGVDPDAENDWFFATHLKYAITPGWTKSNNRFDNFGTDSCENPLEYRVNVEIFKRVNGIATWVSINLKNDDWKDVTTADSSLYGENDVEIILADVEDRSSSTDLNAIRLDSTNLEDYFIGNELKVRINITVQFKENTIDIFDQCRIDRKKQISVMFEGYTRIDIMIDNEFEDNTRTFIQDYQIPLPKNPDLNNKISFLQTDLGGTLSLISAELLHFETSAIGVRFGIITEENGKEIFGQYSLNGKPDASFYDNVMIPYTKLRNHDTIKLFIEIGYWNGRFIGLYDDFGVIRARLDYLKFKWVYSTGFSDTTAGKAYVDQVVDLNFGCILPENTTHIIIHAEMEGTIQGIVENSFGEYQEVISICQPTLRIYNWVTETFDAMDIFALGGNKYQFILDEYLAENLDCYHVEGRVRIIVILDGRQDTITGGIRDEMYYSQLDIFDLSCEFSVNNSYDPLGTYTRIKPTADKIDNDSWQYPELIFKRDVSIDASQLNNNTIISTNISFIDEYSDGLISDNIRIFGLSEFDFLIENPQFNGELIANATLRVSVPSKNQLKVFLNGQMGFSIYWNMFEQEFSPNNITLTGIPYEGSIISSKTHTYHKYLPYTGTPSENIISLWNMDFSSYDFEQSSENIIKEYIFDVDSQIRSSIDNLTSFEVHAAFTTNTSFNWEIGFYDLDNDNVNWYQVSEIHCEEIYFKAMKTTYFILPFCRDDFNRYYSDQGLLKISVRIISDDNQPLELNFNLLDIKLKFNESIEMLANQTYLEYIVDDTFLESLEFWDTFDEPELGSDYVYDNEDFEIHNGYLTKKPVQRNFWDWLFSWWLPKYSPSYLLLNNTKDKQDYYTNFKFNIQNTGHGYKTASWLMHSDFHYSWLSGYRITGLLFRIQAYESSSYNYNKLEIWKRSDGHYYWSLYDTVALPLVVHTENWYDLTTYVNDTEIKIWLNGTKFYDDHISVNDNNGYFGFYSYYERESFIDNINIANEYPSFGGFQDHFAEIEVDLASNQLQYGDAINITLNPMPEYNETIENHKMNLMVNSSDGWLFYDSLLTDSDGSGTFSIDSVDLYTKNIIAEQYPTLIDKRIVSNTTNYYMRESFNDVYDENWVSNYFDDFSLSNGNLEKTGTDWNTYLLTNPQYLPSNYSFDFQAMMNDYSGLEKFEWIVDSDENLQNAYLYRLHSATSSEDANVLRLYKITNGDWHTVTEITLSQEVLIGEWENIHMEVSEDQDNIYHRIFMNDELIFSYTFSSSTYQDRSYLGFRIYGNEQAKFDNVSVYTGSVTWENVPTASFLKNNDAYDYDYYNNVKFEVNDVTHIEPLMLSSSPYDIFGNNSISLKLNMSFPNLLNDYNQKFNLDQYYGIRVGVTLPYDEIVQSVTTYLMDNSGQKHEVILDGANLASLYDNPNARMIFIDGHRLIHTYIDVGLQNTWNCSLANIDVLGVTSTRKSYSVGEYTGTHVENVVGITSIQFIKQLNDYSYNNADFESEPVSQIAVWYQGKGVFYSSFKVFDNIYFRRLAVSMDISNPLNGYEVDFGNSLKINIDLKLYSNQYVPILSILNPASFLLILEKNGKKGYGGIEVVNGFVYNSFYYKDYELELRTFAEAGEYENSEIFWFGNGLFKSTSKRLLEPLKILPQSSTVDLIGNNLEFEFGYSAAFDGFVYDDHNEAIKDQMGSVYYEDFTKSWKSILSTNDNPQYGINNINNLTITGHFFKNNYVTIYNNTFDDRMFGVDYVNLLKFKYRTNTDAIKFLVDLTYKLDDGHSTIKQKHREFTPNIENMSVDVVIDTQLDVPDLGSGKAYLVAYSIKVVSQFNHNDVNIILEEISLNHAPWVYLQIKDESGIWRNLTGSILQIEDSTKSRFSVPLFTSGKQFILNNPYDSQDFGITRNGTLASGDYKLRVWYPGCSIYYTPSYEELYIKVNPLSTALYFVPDNITGPIRDGYYKSREYNSTTIFALEENKPFTLLDVGYTWGDTKNLTFMLSRPTGGFNGISNKPIWFQVGIVPATLHGLKDRDYFADYYPLVRNIQTGELLEQPHVYQGKYDRPLLYDYYDPYIGEIQYYSAYLWMVGFTDENGLVTFDFDFGMDLMEDLQTIFPGYNIQDINRDIYIRTFYANNFRVNDMTLEVGDKYSDKPFACTYDEFERNSDHIFTQEDTESFRDLLNGQSVYRDPIYSSCYAEGVVDIRKEDLLLEGDDFEVTCNCEESDIIPLEAFISEITELSSSEIINEGVPTGDYNKFDTLQGTFVVRDQISGEILINDPEDATKPRLVTDINVTTGRMNATMTRPILTELNPGYYDVIAIIPGSDFYAEATTTFTMLVKSQYTYDFMSPNRLYSFNLEMDSSAVPFRYNETGSRIEDAEYDFIYPTLKGNVWMEYDELEESDGAWVQIKLNDYPIFDDYVTPYDDAVPFEMSLEWFDKSKPLTFNISVCNDEEALGRDDEYDLDGNNIADWVFFNASIFEPTEEDPINGIATYNVLDKFDSTTLKENIYTIEQEPDKYPQVRSSIPGLTDYSADGLLVYPTENNDFPTSVELLLNDAPRDIQDYLIINTNGNADNKEYLLEGYVFEEFGFNRSIHKAFIADKFATDDDELTGAITFTANASIIGLDFIDAYCPYEGKFESIIYAPEIPNDGTTEIYTQIRINNRITGTKTLTATSNYEKIEFDIDPEFYSTSCDIELRVWTNTNESYNVYWIDTNLTGYEDMLFMSNKMPYGQAALFSSRFLYYYINNAADIGLNEEQLNNVWIRLENQPGINETDVEDPYDIEDGYMGIFPHVSSTAMSNYRDISLDNTQRYDFQPDKGIFIRNMFTNINDVEEPELHAGFISMYLEDAENQPDLNELVNRRKITFVVNPNVWETHPSWKHLSWSEGDSASYYLDLSANLFNSLAKEGISTLMVDHDPYETDLIYNQWDYFAFNEHWNRSADTQVNWDYWFNEVVFTSAIVSETQSINTKMDFYPSSSTVNWNKYQELIINFAVNDSYAVDRFKVELINSGITYSKEFTIETNSSENYYFDISETPRDLVSRINIIALPNTTRLVNDSREVFISSAGISLPDPDYQVALKVSYDNYQYISDPIKRNIFGVKKSHNFDLDFIYENILFPSDKIRFEIIGTPGSRIDLTDFAIYEYQNGSEYTEDVEYVPPKMIHATDFDYQRANSLNIRRFLGGQPVLNNEWMVNNENNLDISDKNNQFIRKLYQDFDYDGVFDKVEWWEDNDKQGFDNGIGDFYGIDSDNDGVFEEIYTDDKVVQLTPYDEDDDESTPTKYIKQIRTTHVFEETFTYGAQSYHTSQESVTIQTIRDNIVLPEIRTFTYTMLNDRNPQPTLIIERTDEWRKCAGIEDFEIHKVSKWNPISESYDVEEWNDWEVNRTVLMLGETVELKNVTGILDPSVDQIQLDPISPIQGNNVSGGILWISSYDFNTTEDPLFYDVGLVLVNQSELKSTELIELNYLDLDKSLNQIELCVGIILDINRDHIWQKEMLVESDGVAPQSDVYCPIWEVSEIGRKVLRNQAQDDAWADWLDSYSKGETYVQMIASIVVSVGMTMLAAWALGAAFGPLGLVVSGIVGSFAASLITQYLVSPLISYIFDPDGFESNKRVVHNQKEFMKTRVPAPSSVRYLQDRNQKVSPSNVYLNYKSKFEGYQISIMGSFIDDPEEPNNFQSEPENSDGDTATVINTNLWLFDREAVKFLGSGDIWGLIWKYVQNPFGIIYVIKDYVQFGLVEGWDTYRERQYRALEEQRDVTIAAYEKVFGYDKLENVSVVVYAARQNGRPTYIATKDDYQNTGFSNFWNYSHEIVQIADRNMMLYTAKYQNYYSTDWRSALTSMGVMVAQMVIQMGLTALGTKFVTNKFSWGKDLDSTKLDNLFEKSSKKAGFVKKIYGRLAKSSFLEELGSEIFVEEFLIHSFGDLVTNLFNLASAGIRSLGATSQDFEAVMSEDWDVGTLIEWGFALYSTGKSYVETKTRLAMTYESQLDGKPGNLQYDKLPDLCKRIVENAYNDKEAYQAKKSKIEAEEQKAIENIFEKNQDKIKLSEFAWLNQENSAENYEMARKIVKDYVINNPRSTINDVFNTLYEKLTAEGYLNENAKFWAKIETKDGTPIKIFYEKDGTCKFISNGIEYKANGYDQFIDILDNRNIRNIDLIDPIDASKYERAKNSLSAFPTKKYQQIKNIDSKQKTQQSTKRFYPGTTITDDNIIDWLVDQELTDESKRNGIKTNGMGEFLATSLYQLGIQSAKELSFVATVGEEGMSVELLQKLHGNRMRQKYLIKTIEEFEKAAESIDGFEFSDFGENPLSFDEFLSKLSKRQRNKFITNIIGKGKKIHNSRLGIFISRLFENFALDQLDFEISNKIIPNADIDFDHILTQYLIKYRGKGRIDSLCLLERSATIIEDAKFSFASGEANKVQEIIKTEFKKLVQYLRGLKADTEIEGTPNLAIYHVTTDAIGKFEELTPDKIDDLIKKVKISGLTDIKYEGIKSAGTGVNSWRGIHLTAEFDGDPIDIWITAMESRNKIETKATKLLLEYLNYAFPGIYDAWTHEGNNVDQILNCRTI